MMNSSGRRPINSQKKPPLSILFIDQENSVRSIMAEVLFNRLTPGLFYAYSAGTRPTGVIHPATLEQIKTIGYPFENLRSKSVDEFSNKPCIDYSITVCSEAASQCEYFRGELVSMHWKLPDPLLIDGTEEENTAAFSSAFDELKERATTLITLCDVNTKDAVEKRQYSWLFGALMAVANGCH